MGVNCFQIEDEILPIALFEVPETLAIQEAKLARIKKAGCRRRREGAFRYRPCMRAGKKPDGSKRGCRSGRITEGEITGVLKRHYGTWNPPLF